MPKEFDIDEKIDVEIYRKSKVILNSINFNSVTKSELHRAIDKLAQLDSAEFSAELKQVDFALLKEAMKEMRDNLNSFDLKESMTTREFYQDVLSDEEMEQAESEINNSDESSETENGFASLFFDDKATRIKKKREKLEKLEREHGFQRGYLPYWDSEERLYDKYKGDEEKQLDTKILELESKNLSHDMYLSEREKEIFADDTDGGMW